MDSLNSSHHVEAEVDDPLEIVQIFDIVSYMKGSSCIRMLAKHLGEKSFLEVSIKNLLAASDSRESAVI